MLSGHRIPSPMCVAGGWKIQFHLRTRMLLSEEGEQVEATIHSVAQVTNLRQRGNYVKPVVTRISNPSIMVRDAQSVTSRTARSYYTFRGTAYKAAPAGELNFY